MRLDLPLTTVISLCWNMRVGVNLAHVAVQVKWISNGGG